MICRHVVRRKVRGRPYQFKRNTRRSGRKHIILSSKYNGASCVHVASEKVEERPLGGCINVQKAQLCKRGSKAEGLLVGSGGIVSCHYCHYSEATSLPLTPHNPFSCLYDFITCILHSVPI